ncbi:MAG: hypothetical protein AB7H71_18145 [Alphaproteobacteria bacterium]
MRLAVRFAAAGAVVFVSQVGMAQTTTLTVSPREIVSLANAPEVLELRGLAEPGFIARLRFPNSCYGNAGPSVRAGFSASGIAYAIVLQRTDPRGCPDIFQPVERDAVVRLGPEVLPGVNPRAVRVIGRPVPPEVVHLATPSGEKSGPAGETVIEAQPFAAGAGLPRFAFARLETLPPPQGYGLHGQVTLAPGCAAADLRAQLYEAPNAAGAAAVDIVVLSAPARCVAGGSNDRGTSVTDLSVRVETPQPHQNRYVYVVNEADPQRRPLF